MYVQRYFPFFDEPELIQAMKRAAKTGHGAKIGGRHFSMLLMMAQEEEMRRYRSILERIPRKTYGQMLIEKFIEEDHKDEEDILDLVLEL